MQRSKPGIQAEIWNDTPPDLTKNTSKKSIVLNNAPLRRLLTQTAVNFQLPNEVIENLKQVARERAYKQARDVHYVELIREAIDKTFPMPKKEK